jgi:hypothetical protein
MRVYGLYIEGQRSNKNAYKYLSFDRGLKPGHPECEGLFEQCTLITIFHK